MDPVSPFPAIACLLVAMTTAFQLTKQFGEPLPQGRFATIDGLRGYLAFFVFIYHSSVWYFYLHTGQWKNPPSNLYTHFGLSSVFFFFMITGFLFFSKLLDGRAKSIDWGKLFVSRFLRLVPLYLFVMCLLFLIIAYLSNGKLNEPTPQLLSEVFQWLSFTILGEPNLNGLVNTFTITAGVTWSLPYEWLFYFSLPLLALIIGVIPPSPYLVLSIASVTGIAILNPQFHHLKLLVVPLLSFLGGIAASFMVRSDWFCRFAVRKISSFISLGSIAIAVAVYPSGFDFAPLFLLVVAFILISCGNSMFGILVSPISRTLGEMSYSIYLLHGITLFVTFKFIIGVSNSRALSPVMHWFSVIAITPVLVSICFLTFRYIESPFMRRTSAVTAWLRSCLVR